MMPLETSSSPSAENEGGEPKRLPASEVILDYMSGKMSKAEYQRLTAGFEDPAHPYHAIYPLSQWKPAKRPDRSRIDRRLQPVINRLGDATDDSEILKAAQEIRSRIQRL